jgi:microsomal dipeptidase-like Zn-dependent dipeptidase
MQPKLRQWLSQPGAFTRADFEQFRGSGIDAASFGNAAANYEAGIDLFARWNGFLAAYPDWILRISAPGDFMRAKTSNRYGILFGLQDSTHFRGPEDVDTFYGLGQRSSQLTYNYRTLSGNGAFERHDDGIGEFWRPPDRAHEPRGHGRRLRARRRPHYARSV